MDDEETNEIDQSRIENKADSPVDVLNSTVGEMVGFLGNS